MISEIYTRLQALGIELPDAAPPVVAGYLPAFVPYVLNGNTMHISGRLAKRDGQIWVGKLGHQLTTEEGKLAAREAALEIVSILHEVLGDLARVRRIVRLLVMVNCTPDYIHPHTVANGASELFVAIFGEAGKHARSACGVAQLPFGACVEVEATIEVDA